LPRDHFRFSEFELDVPKRLLLRDGEPVSLNPKALDLLVVLVESRGEIVSKDDLAPLCLAVNEALRRKPAQSNPPGPAGSEDRGAE